VKISYKLSKQGGEKVKGKIGLFLNDYKMSKQVFKNLIKKV